jgi:hypothetical protein
VTVRGRMLVLVLCVGLLATASPGFGQAPAVKSVTATKEIDNRVAEWLKTCLADWDKATHMSRGEWRTVCRRVSAERRTFLIEEATKGISFDPIEKAPRKGTRLY